MLSCLEPNEEIHVGEFLPSSISVAASTISSKDSKVQTKIFAHSPNPMAVSHLNVAIADCIHSNSLPFRLTKDPKFVAMIRAAKFAPSNYVTPTRFAIAGELLDATYNTYMAEVKSEIERDADLLGLTIYGDGATIDKRPMINVMTASAYNPQALCDVIDCSDYMADGGIKDARYICSKYIPVMQKFDPDGNRYDMVVFDGASNVQKGGEVICAKFPMCTIVHGTEHVASLFMGEIFQEECLQIMKKFTRIVSSICLFASFLLISVD